MKKIFFRLVLLGVIALFAAPFILKDDKGNPMLNKEQVMAFDMDSIQHAYQTVLGRIQHFLARNTGGNQISEGAFVSDSEITRLYRWQDEKGEWHFSDQKPAHVQAEKIEIRNNQNILNFGDIDKQKNNKASTATHKKSGESNSGFVNSIKHKLDKAESVQETLDKDFEKKSQAIAQ